MDLISIDRKEGGAFTIKVRAHKVDTEITTKDNEGKDLGPNPSELFVGALGSCIAIMVDSYKGITFAVSVLRNLYYLCSITGSI